MTYRKSLWSAAVCIICCMLAQYRCHAQQVPAAEQKDAPVYTVQVIVLSARASADTYAASLRQKGYAAYVSEMPVQPGKILYRVRIGSFSGDADARRLGQEFTAKEQKPHVIVKSSESIPLSETAPPSEKKPSPLPGAEPFDNQSDAAPVAPESPSGAPAANKSLHTVDRQTTSFYTVQIGTLMDRPAAERLTAALTAQGFPAYLFTEKKNDTVSLYRVRIGKYETEAAAKNIGRHAQAREKLPCSIVRTLATETLSSAEQQYPAPRDDGILEDTLEDTQLPAPSGTAPQAAQPEPQPQLQTPQDLQDIPPAAESRTAAETPPEKSDAVIKIFVFRQANGTLSLTNNYQTIPEDLRKNIEYISLYPVRFVSLDAAGTHLLFDIDGTAKPVVLAGITMPARHFSSRITDYFTKQLNKQALRLRYNPSVTTADGTVIGRLYLREGTYVNPDLVRKGAATVCTETLPADQHVLFKKAEELARREQKGIWATPDTTQ